VNTKISRKEFISSSLALTAGIVFSSTAFVDSFNKIERVKSMKQNVAILIFDDAEVLDFAGPFEVFSVTSQLNDFKPFQVFTISQKTEPIVAVNGLKVVPDFSIESHPPVDILILAGGQGTKKLLSDIELLKWVEKTYETAKLTLGICSAGRVLGKLGMLDGKPFCTHHEVYDHLKEIAPKGIPQKDKRFTQTDERLYTSGGISAGIDLSFHIVEKLLGRETAQRTADYMEYNITL
jgi:transcriptional regulator GlxA family with amidase domain